MCQAQIFSVLVCQKKVGVELKICFCQQLGHTHRICNVCSTLLQSCTTRLASIWRWKCSKGARWWWWCGFLFWTSVDFSSTGPIFRISNLQLPSRFAILCTRGKIPNFGDIGDCDVGPKLMYRTCDSNINLRWRLSNCKPDTCEVTLAQTAI